MTAPTLPLADVEARAAASPRPGVWSAAWVVALHVGRLEADLDRVLLDLSRLRSGHAAEALRAYLAAECGRRRDALCGLRRQAATLRAVDPVVAADAESYAAAHAGEWVEIPGGSTRDG